MSSSALRFVEPRHNVSNYLTGKSQASRCHRRIPSSFISNMAIGFRRFVSDYSNRDSQLSRLWCWAPISYQKQVCAVMQSFQVQRYGRLRGGVDVARRAQCGGWPELFAYVRQSRGRQEQVLALSLIERIGHDSDNEAIWSTGMQLRQSSSKAPSQADCPLNSHHLRLKSLRCSNQSTSSAATLREARRNPANPHSTSRRHMDSSLHEVWQAAAGSPFLPTVGKGSQFFVASVLLSLALAATGVFALSKRSIATQLLQLLNTHH